MEETKVCSKCGKEKPVSEFGKSYNKKYDKYYLRPACHGCYLEISRIYEGKRKDRTE